MRRYFKLNKERNFAMFFFFFEIEAKIKFFFKTVEKIYSVFATFQPIFVIETSRNELNKYQLFNILLEKEVSNFFFFFFL